ncbi:MAG: hypothetical protein WAX77_11375 [Methylococcaceae bacterium]
MTSQENIKNLFKPHASVVIKFFNDAVKDFYDTPNHEKYDKTTRANMINNLVVNRLSTYSAFHPEKRHRTTFFSLNGASVFRIKLTDKRGYSKNISTHAVLNYHNPQCDMPGLPDVIKFEVGYILNSTETEIDDIRVIFRNNKKVSNWFSIIERDNLQNDIEEILTEEFKASSSTNIVKVKKGILPDQNKQIQDKK